MKSKIVSKSLKMVLAYGIVDDNLKYLLEASSKYDFIVRQVMPSELDIKVSQLLKVAQLNLEQYPLNCDRCILMVNFDNSTMEKLLKYLKSKNVDIPLKSVLTPTNKSWSFNKLLNDLNLEHQRFSKS